MDTALSCPQPWRDADGNPTLSGAPTGAAVTVDDEAGTGLLLPTRQTRVAAGLILVLIGAGIGTGAGLLIASGNGAAVVAGVVLGILGLLLLAAGAFSLRRKHRTVGILLTPEQIVLNWVHPAVRLPWQDITEIRPLGLRIGRARTSPSHNYVGVVARGDSSNERMRKLAGKFGKDVSCAVPMRTLDVDQLVVFHTLRFYLDNPDARVELVGPDAVRRVAETRF